MIQRVLIVGLGSIGKRHLRIIRELLPLAEIRVLRHEQGMPVPEGAQGIFSSIEEALHFKPEVAVLANPAPFHLRIAKPLVELGVHLLIEKPLSINSNGIEELIKIAQRTGSKVLVGYNLRYLDSLQHFRNLILEKKCGRVLSVHSIVGQALPSWRPDTDYRLSVSARADLGGGVLLELSHEIDYLRWIFGDVNWTMAVLRKQSALEIDVEDSALMIFEFTSVDAGMPIIANVSLDFFRQDAVRTCTAIGDAGTLKWDGLTGTVEYCSINQNKLIQIYEGSKQADESYLAEWRDFLFCIQNNIKLSESIRDSLAVLKIIEAVRESSLTGTRSEISYTNLKENYQ